jgi:hypothetical protein
MWSLGRQGVNSETGLKKPGFLFWPDEMDFTGQ